MKKKIIDDVLILTMNGENKCFEGTVGIDECGRIGFINEKGNSSPSGWECYDKIEHPPRCLVLPGFVDGHIHANYLPWRYGGEDNRNSAKVYAEADSAATEMLGIHRRILSEAISSGITFLANFADYCEEGKIESCKSGGKLGLEDVFELFKDNKIGGFIHIRLPEDKNDKSLKVCASIKHIEDAIELAKKYEDKARPVLLFIHTPVEKTDQGYCHKVLESYKEVLKHFRNEEKIWIHAHCCERKENAEYAQKEFGGKTSIEVLQCYGLLYERTVLAHCIHISDNDIDLIQCNSARVLTVPKFTDERLARIGYMLDKKPPIRVGLCSDTYVIDPIMRMIQGYHLHRSFVDQLDGFELLRMATQGAAEVFGLDKHIGSIEVRKYANLILLDLSAREFDPFWVKEFWRSDSALGGWTDWKNPIERLIIRGAISRRDVYKVIVGGNEIYTRK